MNRKDRIGYVLGRRPGMALPAAVLVVLMLFGAQRVRAQQAPKAEGERPAQAGKEKADDASRQRELLEVIKELQDEVRQLRREVDQLKAQNAAGKERPGRVGEGDEERGAEGRKEGDESLRKAGKERKKKGHRDGEAVLLKSAGVITEVTHEGKAQKLTFTVKEGGKVMDMTCVLGEATEITLDGKEAQFNDLKAGDSVECQYILKGEKMVAVARVVTAKRGTVLEKKQ